jgi:thymidylate synthase
MINYSRVSDIRNEFIVLKDIEQYVIDKSGVKTLEIINANFIANEPTIFGELNHDYINRELSWYIGMSRYIHDIPGGAPTIWKQVASSNGYINSNYGWCIWSVENYDQYENVLNELRINPNSRRAIMIYTRPTMWKDYNVDGMSDFMCTNTVQYVIRYNKLHAIVQMRSNDVVFGYRNDYAWQSYVLDLLCEDLSIERGLIYWNVGSLHVYSRHFDMVNLNEYSFNK